MIRLLLVAVFVVFVVVLLVGCLIEAEEAEYERECGGWYDD